MTDGGTRMQGLSFGVRRLVAANLCTGDELPAAKSGTEFPHSERGGTVRYRFWLGAVWVSGGWQFGSENTQRTPGGGWRRASAALRSGAIQAIRSRQGAPT